MKLLYRKEPYPHYMAEFGGVVNWKEGRYEVYLLKKFDKGFGSIISTEYEIDVIDTFDSKKEAIDMIITLNSTEGHQVAKAGSNE